MRRILLVLILGVFFTVSQGALAGAATSTPPEVRGTYTYKTGGMAVTVGYICPGNTFTWGADPYANYYALVTKGKSWTSMTRHAPWKLDASLFEYYGVHLSDQANAVLTNDAATIACS
jgi:hypothetical protein